MVRQAQVNGANARGSAPAAVARNMASLTHDMITLAELQVQLFLADLRTGQQRLVLPLVLVIVAALLALSSLPPLIIGLGYLLDELTALSLSASMLIVAGVSLGIALIAAVTGAMLLKRRIFVFDRSLSELSDNIDWLKRVLKHGGHIPPEGVREPL